MSKHPATELKETLEAQKGIPTTSSISEGIERTKEALEEEIQKRGTTVPEYKLAKDTEQFLESSKQFIEEKNKGEVIQRFIIDSRNAVEEMTTLFKTHSFFHERYQFLMTKEQAQIDWNSFAKLNISSMKDLMMNIVNSTDFRTLLNDFVELVQEMYAKTTSGVPSFVPEKQSALPLTEEMKQKAQQTVEFGKQVTTDIQEGKMEVSEDKKQAIRTRFSHILRQLSKDPNYINSVNGLFYLLDQIQFMAYRLQQQTQPSVAMIQTPSLVALGDDAKLFLMNFVGVELVNKVMSDSNEFYYLVINDQQLSSFLNDWRIFVTDILKRPDIIDSEEFNTRYDNLYGRGYELYNQPKYNEKWSNIYRDFRVLIQSMKLDPKAMQLAADSNRLARDLFLTTSGTPSLNVMTKGLDNLRTLVGPILKKNLQNVQIADLTGEDETYRWKINSMLLNLSELVPDNLEFKVWGAANVSLNTSESAAVTYVSMWIRNVGVEAKDLKFYFERKAIPKLEEKGTADVNITGKNELKVTWRIAGSQGTTWVADLHEINCDLSTVDITIRESTHTILMKLITTLFSGPIKNTIERKIEENVRDGLFAINNQIGAVLNV